MLEKELDRASRGVKEWKFSHGELNCSLEDVEESVVDIGVTIDASWSARGWSASDAVVAAISVDTGKVVDVVHLCSSCTECKKMEKKRKEENITRMDYLAWFISHEPNCYGSIHNLPRGWAMMILWGEGVTLFPYFDLGGAVENFQRRLHRA